KNASAKRLFPVFNQEYWNGQDDGFYHLVHAELYGPQPQEQAREPAVLESAHHDASPVEQSPHHDAAPVVTGTAGTTGDTSTQVLDSTLVPLDVHTRTTTPGTSVESTPGTSGINKGASDSSVTTGAAPGTSVEYSTSEGAAASSTLEHEHDSTLEHEHDSTLHDSTLEHEDGAPAEEKTAKVLDALSATIQTRNQTSAAGTDSTLRGNQDTAVSPPKRVHWDTIHVRLMTYYMWAFGFLFLFYEHVGILEDDLDLSPEIHRYFSAMTEAMEKDKSVLSISAWSDNGHERSRKIEHVLAENDQSLRQNYFHPRTSSTSSPHQMKKVLLSEDEGKKEQLRRL
ncbi:unnamed protein product, partial [Amoebophrya sp. A25]